MNRWFLVNVVGEDHPGIAAQVSSVLSAAGMNVVNIGSDVDGTGEKPVYIMIIDGYAEGVDGHRAVRLNFLPLFFDA